MFNLKREHTFLISGILFFFVTIAFETITYRNITHTSLQKNREATALLTDQLKNLALHFIMHYEDGGTVFDEIIEKFSFKNDSKIRIIHSTSLNVEYGDEPEEQPQTDYEKTSLEDGKSRNWETEDFLFSVTPLNAVARCQSCHHLSNDQETSVPLGYTIGLLELQISKKNLKEAEASLFRQKMFNFAFLFLLLLSFLSAIYFLIKKQRKSEERLDGILRSSKEIIWFASMAPEKILFLNEISEKIYGRPVEEFYKNPNLWLEVVHPEDRERVGRISQKLLETGKKELEYRILQPDGQVRWLHDRAWVIHDPYTGKELMTGIASDVTERKQAEKELKEKNVELKKTLEELGKTQSLLVRQEKLASIGTLSSGVCHEILNPLNIMSATIQVMKMDEHSEEDNESLDTIMEQIHRATKITNNLRMFAHQKEAEVKPVDIHELFDKTATLIEHDLQLDNIMINRSYDPDLPLVDADEDQLTQVFLNLLNNAKDAMKGREENIFTIQTKALNNEVEIRFSDTGTGIPKELLGKIFDPFYTTKDPGKGTGLGLSIIHSIIDKHNGTIKVESEEGKGTTFVIVLPV